MGFRYGVESVEIDMELGGSCTVLWGLVMDTNCRLQFQILKQRQ